MITNCWQFSLSLLNGWLLSTELYRKKCMKFLAYLLIPLAALSFEKTKQHMVGFFNLEQLNNEIMKILEK